MEKGKLLHFVALLVCMGSALFAHGNDEQILTRIEESRSVQENKQHALKDGLYIFVSFSMPKSLLWELHQQAKRVAGKLLIRGLTNESFKETIAAIRLEQDKVLSVDINPKAFSLLNVIQVPAFMVLQDNGYDIAYGNVSLSYVLGEFAEHGNTKNKSKALLKKLLPNEQN